MDPGGDGGGGLTATTLSCTSCGTELPPDSRFCNKCGAPVRPAATSAEYKQVTVLFADVVHSMDIAATLGAERLREIMTELVERSAAVVVQRYGGTMEKFTGDGLMALFGAPVALEDHALRACLAALDIQKEAGHLAASVQRRDNISLRLRVGLNSGRVVAGEIGSGVTSYAAIGEAVGYAQRMESVAPHGGVMLSAATAQLVEHAAVLKDTELVRIKGADQPVPVRQLVAIGPRHGVVERVEASLVGRNWEMAVLDAMLDRTIGGRGGVVNVVGPPGIGKSRVAREVGALAASRGIEVFWTFCESHTNDIPFQVVARLLRAGTGVTDLDDRAARERIREQLARRRDTPVHIRAWLVLALTMAGSGGEAMDSADGLIEAAEATGNPFLLALALFAYGSAFRHADPVGALNALGRGLVIAQDSGNRTHASMLANRLALLEAEHGDTVAAFDHLTLAIRNYHNGGDPTTIRIPLAVLAVLFDRLGRFEPAATIAGFALSPIAAATAPRITTAIAHLRDVLGEATYESLARKGETMTTAEMAMYAYDQIDQARAELNAVSK